MLIAVNQLAGEQGPGDALVQTFNAPRTFAHCTQHLKRFKRLQHLACPRSPTRVFKPHAGRRALLAQHFKIMSITFGLRPVPFQRQTLKSAVLLIFERQCKKVVMGAGCQ